MDAKSVVEVPPAKYISRKNAARYLDCSEQLIDKYVRTGRLRAFHHGIPSARHPQGRSLILLRSQVEALITERGE